MQRSKGAAILVLVLCFLAQRGTPALAAPIFNGGFESGDLSGWIVGSGTDGAVNVVAEFQPDGTDAPYNPDGEYYALLSSGEPQAWTSIKQTFDVTAGGSITCRAFYVPAPGKHSGDIAEVRILSGSSVIATPFSWTAESVGDAGKVQWTVFQPQPVPQAGRYTLEARIKNGDTSSTSGYLGIDACQAGSSGPASPSDFTLQVDGSDVEIAWQTAAGATYTGFNIYRSTTADGNYERINDDPVELYGDPSEIQTYSYLDSPGLGTFFYKLEAVGGSGGNQMYGPNSTGSTGSTATPPAFRRPQRHPVPPAG